LWDFLVNLGPNVLVYVMSFMTLGIFWVGQGTQLGQLARSNRHYVWLQLTFLLAVTLVPFSTQLLAHFPNLKLALVEYWLNIVLLGGMLLAAFEYGLHAHLFREEQRSLVTLFRGRIRPFSLSRINLTPRSSETRRSAWAAVLALSAIVICAVNGKSLFR
jgi:uncharacterized membrane protein